MKRWDKRASLSLYITFVIVGILIVLIAAVFAPMGVLFNVEAYRAGELILDQANSSIEGIQDPNVKASVIDVIGSAKSSAQNNIEVNGNIFQYGWIFLLGISALVVFLYSRRLVEVGGGNLI